MSESFVLNRARLERDTMSYADVWGGEFIKSNRIFRANNGAVLGFQIYFDDVELTNPLGSAKGKHKVGMFYWYLLT